MDDGYPLRCMCGMHHGSDSDDFDDDDSSDDDDSDDDEEARMVLELSSERLRVLADIVDGFDDERGGDEMDVEEGSSHPN